MRIYPGQEAETYKRLIDNSIDEICPEQDDGTIIRKCVESGTDKCHVCGAIQDMQEYLKEK